MNNKHTPDSNESHGFSLPPISALLFNIDKQNSQNFIEVPNLTLYKDSAVSSQPAAAVDSTTHPVVAHLSSADPLKKDTYIIQDYITIHRQHAANMETESIKISPLTELPFPEKFIPKVTFENGLYRLSFNANDVVEENIISGWLQISEFLASFLQILRTSFDSQYAIPTFFSTLFNDEIGFQRKDFPELCLLDPSTGSISNHLSDLILISILGKVDSIAFRIILKELLIPIVAIEGRKTHLIELLTESRQFDKTPADSFGLISSYCDETVVAFTLKTFLNHIKNFDGNLQLEEPNLTDILNSLREIPVNGDILMNLTPHMRLSLLTYLITYLLSTPEIVSQVDHIFALAEYRKQQRSQKEFSLTKKLERDISFVHKDMQILQNHLNELKIRLDLTMGTNDYRAVNILQKDIDIIEKALEQKYDIERGIVDSLNKVSSEIQDEFNAEEHQMKIFFLQNQPIGMDRNRNSYWIFQTVKGVLTCDEEGNWRRFANHSILDLLRETLATTDEKLIGDYIDYWLSKPEKAPMLLEDEPSHLLKLSLDFEDLCIRRIILTFDEIFRMSILPYLNQPENLRYQHFEECRNRYIELKTRIDFSNFEGIRKFLLDSFSIIGVTQYIKRPVKLKKFTRKDFARYPPMLYCFSDHEIEDVRVVELKAIESALIEWHRLVSKADALDSLSVMVYMLCQTIHENVENEPIYSENVKFKDWFKSDIDMEDAAVAESRDT